ncbi:MAG: TMEM165/GDT1 family protein [Burkholderiales bacterium]
MEAFLVSTGTVALAEMGDKTQLLALLLAARYRRPLPIILGIACATLANHALAAAFGGWLASLVGAHMLRWLLAASFVAMAVWMLFPDRASDFQGSQKLGVFGTSLLAFFLVELGDKSQAATVVLAANYAALAAVIVGTTLGMLIANVPVVYAGETLLRRVPMKPLQRIAAVAFVALGILALVA